MSRLMCLIIQIFWRAKFLTLEIDPRKRESLAPQKFSTIRGSHCVRLRSILASLA